MTTPRTLALLALIAAFSPSRGLAETFDTVGTANLVESLTFHESAFPVGPLDFGYVDITFVNGVERLGIPLETDLLLADENLPPVLPACSCEGFDGPTVESSASGDFFLAYYFSQPMPGSPTGTMLDGLLIRRRGDTLCVNGIRRTTQPIDVVTVFSEHDCMVRAQALPPIGRLRRWARILDALETMEKGPPIKWPGSLCLSCPPWPSYLADRAGIEKLHRERLRKELVRTIKACQEMLERKE